MRYISVTYDIPSVNVLNAGVRTVDVQAVEGMVAQFPCDLGTAANDKVYMVFWFRDDAGIPLYRCSVEGNRLVVVVDDDEWSLNTSVQPFVGEDVHNKAVCPGLATSDAQLFVLIKNEAYQRVITSGKSRLTVPSLSLLTSTKGPAKL
ncbi:unnamed protein product [Arctia plantaginis]|uniref:Uncharacterized protein n=1 Tax=Arctia plantaginis TaxID=874455 RepID=A0A8S0ZAP1_ARCPL|nr:unnamed protein product [Arctia plantaginis]